MEGHTIGMHRHELYTHTEAPINEVANLLQLTGRPAKQAVSKTSPKTALVYLLELFRGNGWNVSLTYRAAGGALLLSYPKSSQSVALIVKFSTGASQLTYEEVHKELVDFENNLSPQYKCNQFAIISLNGIAPAAESLEKFNLLLQDWSYIDDLIKNYRTVKIKEPRIQLFAHNKQTYKKVRSLMKSARAIAVVQATGTGKSFLIARLLQDFAGEKRLVMAPSIYVIDQVKEHIGDETSIEYMTYARSMNLSQSEIAALSPKLIVLDEFHRCGAEEWGRGVENILNAYPDAYRLGTSATPIRYLDNARDMSHELFNNNVAENLSLAQAIVRNILPMPKYVCAIYTLAEERDILRERISKSRFPNTVKKQIRLDLDAASIDWERSHGISSVLGKYLQPHMKKFIVFCKDEAHLLEMETVVTEWFKSATNVANIQAYRIYDGEPKSDDNLKAFKSADTAKSIHLLFSINMLNEGLHVNEVSGVVLLRPTESPNIFYQQIGRCLKVGLNYSPVIFDFVNNFRSIRTHDFLYDLEFARSKFTADRISENLEERCPAFNITDEVREITEIFGEIKFKLDGWEVQFQKLVAYKQLFGNCRIPDKEKEYGGLRQWLLIQRGKIEKGLLEPERRDKLLALGVDMNLHKFEGWKDELWEKNFEELNVFRQKFGHCNVGDPHKECRRLRAFVSKQRHRYNLKTLEAYRINKLLSIGFKFKRNFSEGLWQERFDELIAYKNEHGHLNATYNKHKKLAAWMLNQRALFRENKLDAGRQLKLNSINFDWKERRDEKFEKNFSELITWYQKNKSSGLPENASVHSFANYLRLKRKKNALSNEDLHRLQSIGFEWKPNESNAEVRQKRILQFREFFKLNGHGRVTLENENYGGLSAWLTLQRKHYRRKLLTKEDIKILEDCGMVWKFLEDKYKNLWETRYEKLLALYNKSGSVTYPVADEILNNWCSTQRKRNRQGKIAKERIEKLNALGFKWDIAEATWDENLAALAAFKEKQGHCRVNASHKNNVLGIWVSNTRASYKDGILPAEKIQRLESIGFLWEVNDAAWREKYETLKMHLKVGGWEHTRKKNNASHEWINKQRMEYRSGTLAEDKIMLLNMLGIDWDPLKNSWHIMFQEFLNYKKTHNSVRISYSDKSYSSLYKWCFIQRKNYRKNKMPEDKFTLLNNAGFQWNLKER